MSIDGNTLKIGLLCLFSVLCCLSANVHFSTIKVSNTWLATFFTYVGIVIHYFYIGDSITLGTNEILVCGITLLVLSVCIGNAFDVAMLLRPATSVLFVAALLFMLVNLPQALTGNEDAFIDGNYVGTTANANMLGGYLALCCFPLFLHYARQAESLRLRQISWILLVACCYLIFMTRSRAALLVISASSVFLIMTTERLRRGGKFLLLTIILAGTLSAALLVSDKYGEAELLSTRSILLLQRITAISERPWLGWGFNSDVYNYYDESNFFPAMEKGNTVLQAFEEFGIPFGTFAILGLFYIIWRAALVLRQKPHGLAFSATLIGCAVHLMFETWLFNFPALLSIYFWIILLLAGYLSERKIPPSS